MDTVVINTVPEQKTKRVKIWLNVYENGRAFGYPSHKKARQIATFPLAAAIAIPIEVIVPA